MTAGNGSSVTRAELAAHIKGIDEHFDTIENDVRLLRAEVSAGFSKIAEAQWLGPQGRSFLSVGGFAGAVVAVLIAIFH